MIFLLALHFIIPLSLSLSSRYFLCSSCYTSETCANI